MGMGMGGGGGMSRFGIEDGDKLDRAQTVHVARRTFRMLGEQRLLVWGALAVTVLWTGCNLAGPWLVRNAIDHGIRPPGDSDVLNRDVALYLVVACLQYVTQRTQIMLIARVGEGWLRRLRLMVFAHLQALSMPFYDREKAGVIVSRMTSDIDSLAELIQMGLLQFASQGLLVFASVIFLLFLSWQLSLVVVATLPLVILSSVRFKRDSNRAYLDVRDRIGQTLSGLQEGIAGVRVVQAFARERVQIDRFEETNRSLFDAHMRSTWIQSWYIPVIEYAQHICVAGTIGVGGFLVHRGSISLGTVAAFVLLLNTLFEPMQQLTQLLNTLQSAAAALSKLYTLLDTPVDVPEPVNPVDLPARGEVRVEGVSFSYATGNPVLRDVDLTIAPGERLALVGPTGAGKSTLAKLVARLYDVTSGRITFGGVDVREAPIAALRRRVVVVPQEGFLFNGTILDNIRMARIEATEEEVWTALRDIGVLARFEALPDGLHTEVQERGSRFSAGEKQLVSLARAALVDPAVLVLDEATSSLDPGTELLVEHALERLMEGRTVIVIAHRLSTAERADRVGVVADGRLAELGTHDELVAAGGQYATLFAAWAGGVS
jgi:ATP-binding cassette subfamily B protein